jgi:hypothetical protein
MSRQQLSLFRSAPRDRAVIQVISVKTLKTAAILFIDSVTVNMTSGICDVATDDCRYFPISGQFILDTRNHQQGKMHKMSIKPMAFHIVKMYKDKVSTKMSKIFCYQCVT